MTINRNDALNEIARLAAAFNISMDEISARMIHSPSPGKEKGLVGRLFSYIGGIFVFSGICVLVSMIWDDIGSAQRVILTFGPGLAAFILGIVALKEPRFEKTSTPLFLISALLQPTGIFVFLREYMPESDNAMLAVMLVFGTIALQQGLAFLKYRRSSLLFFALFFWNGFIGTAMDWIDVPGEIIGIVMGISMLSLSWAVGKTAHRAMTPLWYFFGGITLLSSWWAVFEGTFLDLSYLGLNAFLVYLSIAAASRILLFVSVLGLLGYLGYFAEEYFADAVGWPVCLIVLGLVMMGLSAYAVKLGRRIAEQNAR